MRVPGSPTGAGRSTKRFTMEKMVELAAMPSPMENMTANTNPGDRKRRRKL